jgi:branched-chain amino acid transport system ATP-binding protein
MLLSLENVSAAYGATEALRGVSIDVDAGEVVTLIGANGAGKSTSLLAISGLVKKTAGRIRFDGVDITNAAPHDIVRMGIVHVPEGRRIFPRLTVEENLRMGAFTLPSIDRDLLDRAFALFPILKERRTQAGGTLSGGEQQMLAIARGLMARPKLLLLDEPSLGIAPKLIEKIFEALAEIHKGGTPILLVEQNAQLALEFAQRAYVLETGGITLSGAGCELMHDEAVKKAYLGL